MCEPISLGILAGAAVLGTGASIIQGAKADARAKEASASAERRAREAAAENDRNINRQNQKRPDLNAMFSANRGINGGGAGSTTLTGPAGVSNSALLLGRKALLGG